MSVTCHPRRQSAFTMVELLVAMVVASLLASTVLLALWGAQEDARGSRTRAQIAKINSLLLRQWEVYATRNVAIDIRDTSNQVPPHRIPGRIRQFARLMALRDLMRMEMPDRMTDLMQGKVVVNIPQAWLKPPYPSGTQIVSTLQAAPRLARLYQRRLIATLGQSTPGVPNFANWSKTHESAECLYLILSATRDYDSNALDYFQESEIGDVDNDGMPEILDGWGNPIHFLRWAPGYRSDIQTLDREDAPDHLDPLKLDPSWASAGTVPYLLVPLIYSAGADEEYGLVTDNDPSGSNGPHDYYAILDDPLGYAPYAPLADGFLIGEPIAGAVWSTGGHFAEDNLTNHLIEVR